MSATFCRECGAKLLSNAKFCSKCGTAIEYKPAVQPQVQTSGFCAKCGAPLLKGAVCCSKCGADVGQPAAPAQPTYQPSAVPQSIGAQTAQIRSTASQLGQFINAPAGQGEFSLGVSEFGTEVVRSFGQRFGFIFRLLAGLGAGGLSFAAIFRSANPAVVSAAVSAGAVVLRIVISMIRRRRK